MEQHFPNRPTQAQQQQHVYSTSPFSVYSNQPPYLTGTYQPVAQPQQIAYQQAPAQYSRPVVGGSGITTCNMQQQQQQQQRRAGGNMQQQQQQQQRRAGGAATTGANQGGGMNRGPVPLHQSAALSASTGPAGAHHPGAHPAHQHPHAQMQHAGNMSASGDAQHSLNTAGAPIHTLTSLAPHHRALPSQDMPLRIVVDAKYVGAIIGQGGSNIREITKESKARCVVDVQRAVRDPAGNAEKVISIMGQPENCTKACVKILEVVRREMEKDSTAAQHPEIELKIRVHNQLVGRLIGKGGATIKKIMEETGAVVFVSNEPARDMFGMLPGYGTAPPLYAADMAMHMERTVTVKASEMNVVSAAEQKISQKLRSSYEYDLNNRVSLTSEVSFLTLDGAHIRSVMRMTGAHVRIEGGGSLIKDKKDKVDTKDAKEVNADEAEKGDADSKQTDASPEEKSPESNEEGAGDAEKSAKKDEKEITDKVASISVSKSSDKEKEKEREKEKDLHADERLVTITGNEGQQYKVCCRFFVISLPNFIFRNGSIVAQFWIYQRVAEQSYHYLDEVRLCTEINVPSKLVGRIIGKGGQNVENVVLSDSEFCCLFEVRELQRVTGAQVKIPDDAGEDETQESTTVRILGNFQASQAVQARLNQLIHEFTLRQSIWPANGQPHTQGI
ncbi:unnamed protein product [Anisakis simplex]|uniref:Insulin-like growth factor 2 mRNA-binding protein 3 n=1 Tax=Anisakis simplex TaxID=6269 RepID=A0A0M3K2P0_ANISI|nr:unnamed protein product [Anisakis simplex]